MPGVRSDEYRDGKQEREGLALAESRIVRGAERDVHALLVGVEVDRPVAALVPEARGLHPAERRAEVADVVRVQPDHPRLDRLREVVRAPEIVGPDVGGEAIPRVVGEAQRLLLGVEGRDRDDGAEDLLLEDPRVGGHVGEHRRGHVVARREPVRASATGDEATLCLADLDVAHDLLVVLRVHERADLRGGVVRVADLDALR
ncbi:hypothetical protein ABE10_10505, partial [Bacillus toyonensis]|nr:hypothetical protein [Bacillus toyonensis]